MKSNRVDLSLKNDNRAVAPLIGFILLFGFLVIAFTGYQAQVVPQQNAETEFEHFQQNHNELIELRSSILTAGTSDRPQFPTIELGTTYRTRILAVNGPDPAGVLQTSDPYEITISDGNASTDPVVVNTRFLEYQPGYNQLSVGSTWYENSVLYLDELESNGGRVIIEDQNLVTDGDKLRITALQNELQRSGTNRITLELYPTSVEGNLSNLEGELSVQLPTRLGQRYWDGQFTDSSAVTYDGFEEDAFESGVNQTTLTVDSVDSVELNTVGIRKEPTEGSARDTSSTRDQNGGNGGNGGEGSIIDDSDLSFDGLPTAAVSNSEGNTVEEIRFDFELSNPDEADYQIVFGVRRPTGEKTTESIANVSSPEWISGGDALSYQIQGGGQNDRYLDVEIILQNENGSVVDTRTGRLTSQGDSTSLT